LFHNAGVYAEDTWRVNPRFTLTYGVRWDVDAAPSTASGASLSANLGLAPAGIPPFTTSYTNFAPRIGLAYVLSLPKPRMATGRAGRIWTFLRPCDF
jgi:outer membrane receptor protein involved in Fe transport